MDFAAAKHVNADKSGRRIQELKSWNLTVWSKDRNISGTWGKSLDVSGQEPETTARIINFRSDQGISIPFCSHPKPGTIPGQGASFPADLRGGSLRCRKVSQRNEEIPDELVVREQFLGIFFIFTTRKLLVNRPKKLWIRSPSSQGWKVRNKNHQHYPTFIYSHIIYHPRFPICFPNVPPLQKRPILSGAPACSSASQSTQVGDLGKKRAADSQIFSTPGQPPKVHGLEWSYPLVWISSGKKEKN